MFSGISTILPVYLRTADTRSVQRLRRAMESVLTQQSAIRVELILIDDGSPMPVAAITDLHDILSDPRIMHIRPSRNLGLANALNTGLVRAKYDLIARIDADDHWRPLKLAKQFRAFSDDPDLSLVGTAFRINDEDKRQGRDERRGTNWRDALEFLVEVGCPFAHGSILARKDIFMLLGGYPQSARTVHCEDLALWVVWLRFFKCAMLDEVLFEYRISRDQISTLYADQQRRATIAVQQGFVDLASHNNIPDAVEEVAHFMNRSLLETSKILFLAWRYYEHIVADPKICQCVRTLMPDRRVVSLNSVRDLLTDRCFFIQQDQSNAAMIGHGIEASDVRRFSAILAPSPGAEPIESEISKPVESSNKRR